MMSEDDEYNVTVTSQDDDYNESYDVYYGNDTDGMYEFYAVPQLIFVSILSVFIIVGNSCVLAAIRLSENGRKSRMNFFIMHLALADLLVGVMVCLADLGSKITVEWLAGNAMCKIIQYAQAVVTYSSTFMLVSLSIDRYDAVARPMNFSRSGYQGRFLVYTAWIVSFLLALPALFIYQEEAVGGKKQCWLDFPADWHWKFFFTAVAVVTFLMPAIIIASCYIAIIYIIWSKGQSHEPHCPPERVASHQGGTTTPTRLTINDRCHATGRGIIPQAKIRTIKMTLIIVIVFILCWSPYFLYNLLDVYNLLPVDNSIATFIQSAGPLNSAANPIIYGIFSTRICKNLRRFPMPECLREMVCRCKETKKCNRLAFRGRNHKFMASQTTDPTLTTYEAQRRSNQCLSDLRLSSLKPTENRYASLISKHFLDRGIFAETIDELQKRKELEKKHTIIKFPRNKWTSNKLCGEYEMTPLTKRGLTRHIGSSGSDDSSVTSESNGRSPNSKRIIEVKIMSEKNYSNNVISVKHQRVSEILLKTISQPPFSATSDIVQASEAERVRKGAKICPKHEDQCEKFCKNINAPENQHTSSAGISVEQCCEVDDHTRDDETNSTDLADSNSQDSTGRTTRNTENSSEVIARKKNEFTDTLARDRAASDSKMNRHAGGSVKSEITGTKDSVSDRTLANRRPSGVPTVRRRLTSEENAILRSIAGQLLVNEVLSDESAIV